MGVVFIPPVTLRKFSLIIYEFRAAGTQRRTYPHPQISRGGIEPILHNVEGVPDDILDIPPPTGMHIGNHMVLGVIYHDGLTVGNLNDKTDPGNIRNHGIPLSDIADSRIFNTVAVPLKDVHILPMNLLSKNQSAALKVTGYPFTIICDCFLPVAGAETHIQAAVGAAAVPSVSRKNTVLHVRQSGNVRKFEYSQTFFLDFQ